MRQIQQAAPLLRNATFYNHYHVNASLHNLWGHALSWMWCVGVPMFHGLCIEVPGYLTIQVQFIAKLDDTPQLLRKHRRFIPCTRDPSESPFDACYNCLLKLAKGGDEHPWYGIDCCKSPMSWLTSIPHQPSACLLGKSYCFLATSWVISCLYPKSATICHGWREGEPIHSNTYSPNSVGEHPTKVLWLIWGMWRKRVYTGPWRSYCCIPTSQQLLVILEVVYLSLVMLQLVGSLWWLTPRSV